MFYKIKKFLLLLLYLIIIVSTFLFIESISYVEFNDLNLKVSCDQHLVKIEGFLHDSSLIIVSEKIGKNGQDLTIFIEKGLFAFDKRSGSVNLMLNVPQNINNIYFGKNKTLIWNREKKCSLIQYEE
jgi:hypothetical protein